MKDLRRRFERFCLKNRGKGIPNLMLVIAIGNLAVYMLSRIDPSNIVYSYLCFSRSAILRGQVWRLFSYIFTYLNDVRGAGLLLAAVLIVWQARALSRRELVCRFCGKQLRLPWNRLLLRQHVGNEWWLFCPTCGRKTWFTARKRGE